MYGEGSSEFWGGERRGYNETEVVDFGAGGSSMTGTALTDPSVGLGGWETHGIDTFFHGGGGGRGGGPQAQGRNPGAEGSVLDLDGRRRYAYAGGGCSVGGGPAGEERTGGWGEVITPFQRWKRDRGIVSPGVAEVFAGQGC